MNYVMRYTNTRLLLLLLLHELRIACYLSRVALYATVTVSKTLTNETVQCERNVSMHIIQQ